MLVEKTTLNQSPFIGVFGKTTSRFTLIPPNASQNEKNKIERAFQTPLITTTLASSPLLGVFCIANQNGIIVPQIAEPNEIKAIEQHGISVLQLSGTDALGNLASVNDHHGIASPLLNPKHVEQIEAFLKIKIIQLKINQSDLVGSNCILTNNGFITNPNTAPQEFKKIEQFTGLTGNRTSANFGDPHIGNSVLANPKGALVGPHSTPHEQFAIDEALSGHA